MKRQKKILVTILVFLTILLYSCQVFATDFSGSFSVKISEKYIEWLKNNIENPDIATMPKMYDISSERILSHNPIKLARMLGSSAASSGEYSLKTIIPENMVIKNQQETNSCWTFSSLASLETNLALKNKKNNLAPIVYDFSERHMEYATSDTFSDGKNPFGFNRKVDDGGVDPIFISYFTNGIGAVAESSLPFQENNSATLSLSDIDKDVISQVNDIVTFASYKPEEDKTEIIQLMKQHINNYGAISATIHGVGPLNSNCYNNENAAIYCNHDEIPEGEAHAVAIVGWIDNFPKENFTQQPQNNGAWIIKNSWGTEHSFTILEFKQQLLEEYLKQPSYGITDISQIDTDKVIEVLQEDGYTIKGTGDNAIATIQMGDEGYMYMSYEDYHVYSSLTAIEDADDEVKYDNLYQYNKFGGDLCIGMNSDKVYLATIFDKKTQGTEYLEQISIMTPETYTCKVFVNPNGTSKAANAFQQVPLKAGETETFGAGYHTIEFAEPVQITGQQFVVMVEIDSISSDTTYFLAEWNCQDYIDWFVDVINTQYNTNYTEEDLVNANQHIYDNVEVASGKCFVTNESGLNSNTWNDTSTFYEDTNGLFPSHNTTIKAFTTSDVFQGIEITNPPAKTKYFEGEDFDSTGMVVKTKNTNGESEVITDYTITNGTVSKGSNEK